MTVRWERESWDVNIAEPNLRSQTKEGSENISPLVQWIIVLLGIADSDKSTSFWIPWKNNDIKYWMIYVQKMAYTFEYTFIGKPRCKSQVSCADCSKCSRNNSCKPWKGNHQASQRVTNNTVFRCPVTERYWFTWLLKRYITGPKHGIWQYFNNHGQNRIASK